MDYINEYKAFRVKQKTFNSKGGTLKYIDEGKGEVILLLHGVPTSGWLYRKMIPLLVDKGYRVIVPDMLGFGSSDNPEGYEVYNEKNHASRLLALMDFLKVESWKHVFHDAGGLWTWELLKLQPKRINKLVILNTIIYPEGFKPPIRFKKNAITMFIMKLYSTKLLNKFLVRQLFKNGIDSKLTQQELEGYRTPLLEGKVNGMYYFFSKTCHLIPDNKSLLRGLNKPVSVIWGNDDPFLKWEPQAEQVIKDLNIELENIHILNDKHFIQEKRFEEVANIIIHAN
ncbi:MAG: alpha/beta fold hydrolase [Gelidibacter sp.]|nr:alpha/beta fold hydrolase [Gelidibacter sp.]